MSIHNLIDAGPVKSWAQLSDIQVTDLTVDNLVVSQSSSGLIDSGSWTPTYNELAGLTVTNPVWATYTRINNIVTAEVAFLADTLISAIQFEITSLPVPKASNFQLIDGAGGSGALLQSGTPQVLFVAEANFATTNILVTGVSAAALVGDVCRLQFSYTTD
jgi:hypothetical protein